MKPGSILRLGLPFLLSACSLAQNPSASATPTPARRVDISAGADTLQAGELAAFTGTIIGSFGNPQYYVLIEDTSDPPSALRIILTPGNVVREISGASSILELVSTDVETGLVSAVFRARAAGTAEVVIAVNGEIVESDGSGRFWFNYISVFSEGAAVTVLSSGDPGL
jgi:hypothetical protein